MANRKRWILAAVLVCAICVSIGMAGLFLLLMTPGPNLAVETEGVMIFDRQDKPVALLKSDRTLMPVPLSAISKNLRQAIVAAEDKNFYSHFGVDPFGIIRAVLVDAESHKMIQGGSTLTQQLVKNLYFVGRNRTVTVKLREAFMAVQLDRRYSKDQILEAYLNNVYFGSGTYGVEEAAERYFGKSAGTVSLPEAAYLSGLVNAPTRLSVRRNDAIAREQAILDNMARYAMITEKQAQAAKQVKLQIKSLPTPVDECSYYLIHVRKLLEARLDPNLLYRKGVRAYTNLDVSAQQLASHAITTGIRHAPFGVSQGALVSISIADGGVLALVGGAGSFQNSPWDRALNPHTAGSAFKPFVYLTGILSGTVKPDTMIDDAPLAVELPGSQVYSPKNFDGTYMGSITVRKALALSRNTCAVRVGEIVGPDKIVEVARAAGITSDLKPTLALSLGASAVSPLDMASAYSTLARGGVRIEPQFLRSVTKADGTLIEAFPLQQVKAFDQEPVAELVDILQDVVQTGTATHAKLFGRPVAGKTGTADGARDIWFVGFTPDVVTAVWGGNDQNLAIAGRQVTGGTIMAGIWQGYMQSYYAKHSTAPGSFALPQNPFIVEPEPVHFLPSPAGIYDNATQILDPNEIPKPGINQESSHSESSKHKGGFGKFVKKLFNMF